MLKRLCRPAPRRPNVCAPTVTGGERDSVVSVIELRETEVDVLIRKGLLRPDARNDLNAVVQALYHHLDDTLGA